MKQEFYSQNKAKSVLNLAMLFLWIAVPLISLTIFAIVYGLIIGKAKLPDDVIYLLILSYGLYIGISIPHQTINQFNTIQITEDGLMVRVFIFGYRWKLIKWENISEISTLPRPDRWGKVQWMISVKGLTYWHKLINQRHGFGPKEGIVISSDMDNRETLLKIVERKVKKNNSAD